jgi:hypothetical protein
MKKIVALFVLLSVISIKTIRVTAQPVTVTDSSKLIRVISPKYCSDVKGNTLVKFKAPGATNALVKCWIQDGTWGHDSIFPVVKLDKNCNGKFVFPANRFPHGPTCIRISAGNDQCHLQLYNISGIKWKEGIPAVPPQAAGMKMVFQDDFSGPLSISASGVGKTYCSRHIDGSFGKIPFADYESPKNPFFQRDTYLRIRADINKGSAGLISTRRSDSTYSCAVKFGYFECRFIGPMVTGSWPAFWGCTARGRTPETKYCDEIDVIEAYGNAPDKYEANWHIWEKKHTSSPKTESVQMMTIGSRSNWSTTSHIYGVLIKEDSISYYCDNIKVWQHPTTPYCRKNAFYVMINLAITGSKTKPFDLRRYDNIADMYVDYLRVFQYKPDTN